MHQKYCVIRYSPSKWICRRALAKERMRRFWFGSKLSNLQMRITNTTQHIVRLSLKDCRAFAIELFKFLEGLLAPSTKAARKSKYFCWSSKCAWPIFASFGSRRAEQHFVGSARFTLGLLGLWGYQGMWLASSDRRLRVRTLKLSRSVSCTDNWPGASRQIYIMYLSAELRRWQRPQVNYQSRHN